MGNIFSVHLKMRIPFKNQQKQASKLLKLTKKNLEKLSLFRFVDQLPVVVGPSRAQNL